MDSVLRYARKRRERGLIIKLNDYVRIAHGSEENKDFEREDLNEEPTNFDNDHSVGCFGLVKRIYAYQSKPLMIQKLFVSSDFDADETMITISVVKPVDTFGYIEVSLNSLVNYSLIPEAAANRLYDETCDNNLSIYEDLYSMQYDLIRTRDDNDYAQHLLESEEFMSQTKRFWQQVNFGYRQLKSCQIKLNKKQRMKVMLEYAKKEKEENLEMSKTASVKNKQNTIQMTDAKTDDDDSSTDLKNVYAYYGGSTKHDVANILDLNAENKKMRKILDLKQGEVVLKQGDNNEYCDKIESEEKRLQKKCCWEGIKRISSKKN